MLFNSFSEIFSSFLESFFAEESEHVFLVSLNAWLVERINFQHIAAQGATHFEEIDKFAYCRSRDFRNLYYDVRHSAVNVSEDCSCLRGTIHLREMKTKNNTTIDSLN